MKHSLSVLALVALSSVWAQAEPVSEIIQQALQKAPAVLQVREDVSAAERELGLVRQSIWMPQLTVSAVPLGFSGSSAQGNATVSVVLSLLTGTTLQLSYSGNLNYMNGGFRSTLSGEVTHPLFSFKLTDAALELDRRQEALEEARQTLSETQRQVMLDALGSILDLTIAQESLEIAQARVEISKRRLDAVRSKVQSGQAGKTEFLTAQIELRQSELTLAKLQRDFALAQERFLVTYGLEKMLPWQAPAVREETKSLAEELLHLEITPEVVTRDARVRRALRQVADSLVTTLKVQFDALPQLGLTASYDPQNTGWSVGISVRHSLLTDQALKREEAQQMLATAQRTLTSVRATVRVELLAQRNALHEAYSQLEVLALKDKLIALQHEMKQQQRELGLLSETEWEEFLIEKREFENARRAALYQLAIAYLRYKNSLSLSFSLKEVFDDQSR